MSGQVKRPSVRAHVSSLLQKQAAGRVEDGKDGWPWRSASTFVAKGLLKEAKRAGADDPRRIHEQIEKIEQAWTLTHDPRIAIRLATTCDRVNRNEDAPVVLREAFHRDPRHPLVRHHAAINLLRHGAEPDIRDFFPSGLKMDPECACPQFATSF